MRLGTVASTGATASAEEWQRRARRNARAAAAMLENGFADMAAFHAQQAAEFALKALEIQLSGRFTRTHDLTELARRVQAPPRIIKLCAALTPRMLLLVTQMSAEPGLRDAVRRPTSMLRGGSCDGFAVNCPDA